MNLFKRSGTKVPFDLSKWQAHIAKMCEGVPGVSPSMIEIAAQPHFQDGMTTRELDDIALKSIVSLIDEELNPDTGDVNYQMVAGKHRNTMLRKDVFGSWVVPHLYDIVKQNVADKLYTPDLLTWYTEDEWNFFNKHVDHEKDENLPYAAVEQLIEKYLVRNRATGRVVETPQVRYMVAAATMFHAEKKDRLKWVRDFYTAASDGQFTLATPVLAGLGTKTKQFSSCVLLRTDDDLDSIFDTGKVMANYAAKRAGIGLEFGRMRPLGAPIRDGEVMHTGILPFLKKWFGDLRSCSQGGIRNASATMNFPIWHYQFDDYITMKNNKGTDETRVRQLDYCVVLSSFFWKRFLAKGDITFFDPNQVPDLYEAFYRDIELFEKLYVKYEKRTDLRTKVQPAELVMKGWIINERSDTGRIYFLNIDNVQRQGSLDPRQYPVYQTNLCTEIMLHTEAIGKTVKTRIVKAINEALDFTCDLPRSMSNPKIVERTAETITFELDEDVGRIALCTLGSMNWGAVRHPEDLRRPLRLLHRGLHNLLQYQDFLSSHSYMHNLEFEPLGIGITNLAYWHAKRKLKYGTEESLAEVKRWNEHQNFYLTEMSVDLAEEKGPCLKSADTCYGKGIFPWERRAPGVNELTDFTPDPDLPWEPLRIRMVKFGVKNAHTGAIAPVESSSVVLNSTNGGNLVKQLIVTKRSKAGDFVQVVPEYRKLKNYYELQWEQPDCLPYLKTMAVLQVHTDQGISIDTYYTPRNFRSEDPEKDGKIDVNVVIRNHLLAHKWGIKSFYYHLVEKQASVDAMREEPASIDEVNAMLQELAQAEEEYCESCVL
jgi:ribonucleoside-diphosphate reductase alpha chain